MDGSTRILAIRHGETAWNREARIQGQLDIPLNETGLAQAQRLARALVGEGIDALYASDLSRARQTAAAVVAELGLELRLDAELRERSFGVFEGHSWPEITARWPAESEAWRRRDADFGAPGGEVLQDFYQRSVAAFERIARAHPGQTLAIVTHGGVLDCLHRAGSRQSLTAPRSWKLGNAAINRLLYSPQGFTVVGWNDEFHLDGLLPQTSTQDEPKPARA
ncbi:histidine phosphatase family protein [Paucibacter sp. KBW04]|nr:histidine phosphatase family protein [Paucibacter sp. KBW04]RQO54369.1 histidine phosphatase family protein [Paucibacter sp. KBW04]